MSRGQFCENDEADTKRRLREDSIILHRMKYKKFKR